jgi:phage virion morphogenesis family|nr:MAG TPA: virion morphogenesis protein [Caudoviricetes sp.]
MKINIKTNIDSVSTSFKEKLRSINKGEMLEEVAFYMENEMRKRFDTETDYQGNKWEKLKLREGKILSDTGMLKGSLGTAEIKGNTVTVFSNLVYAKIHDEGGVIKAKNFKALHWKIGEEKYFAKSVTIPKRQFSGVSDKNKEDLIKIINEYFVNKKLFL